MLCGVGGNVQNIADACRGDSGGAYVRQVIRNFFEVYKIFICASALPQYDIDNTIFFF